MIHFFKFRQDLFGPVPAKDMYIGRPAGKGWPEECPPIRAANSFGWDVLANFDLTFLKNRDGTWRVKDDIVITSDFDWAASEESDGEPLVQQYAWFWQKGQKLPHVITDNVFEHVKNQVKVSSFLYLKTDPNELLLMTEVPNQEWSWRTKTGLVDSDWYPASYCWHVVLELPPSEKKVEIKKGTPICRLIPVKRDTYFAEQMTPEQFDQYFAKSQQWIASHGRVPDKEGQVDLTRTYVRQQMKAKFVTME